MKFNIILLFLIILSINVLAEEITLAKNIYSPYETLQAKISLDFLPVKDIQPNQIFLFDSSSKSYYIAPFLIKFDDTNYYTYFDLPYNSKEDNYSLKITKIFYILDKVMVEKIIIKQFSMINDTNIISITPAIINLSSPFQDFYIKAFTHGNLTTVKIETSNGITHLYDKPQQIGNSRSFKFTANSKNIKEEVIFFYGDKNYTIPIYISIKEQPQINLTINETNIKIKEDIPITLITNLSSITKYIDKKEIMQGPLPIKNNLNKSIIINFSLTGNLNEIVDINTTSLILKPYEIKEQYFIINQNKNLTYYEYDGNLLITTFNYSINFPMIFYINQEIIEPFENKTEEINENLFDEEEQEIIEPFENKTIEPEIKEESNNTFLILSIIIFIIILIIILSLVRKKHRERTFNEYLKTIERR